MLRLVIRQAGQPERVVELDQACVKLGRDPSNDVVLRDSFVSARHGEIRVQDGLAAYEDFATTNGSVLRRGERTIPVDERSSSRILLEDGDELLLGDAHHPVVVRVGLRAAKSRAAARPREMPAELDATHAESVGRIRAASDREALIALHALASRLCKHLDLSDLLPVFADSLLEVSPKANHVAIYLLDDASRDYRPAHCQGRWGDTDFHALSRMVRDRVLARGKAVVFNESSEDLSASLHEGSVRAGMCAPLWDGERIVGLVQVDCRGTTRESFGKRDLAILVLFAHQAALAIQNARLHEGLRRSCEQSIRGLVRALEAKDEYTSGHSEAVAELSRELSLALGLSASEAETVRRAALLHDIGKIGIPYEVLNKKERLTPEEFRVLKTHPDLGARILEPFGFLGELIPIVLHHHERWDGRGYPHGLAGTDIPKGARILSVADTYHALVSNRAYRDGVGDDVALEELRRHAGTQFDRDVVEALVALVLGRRTGGREGAEGVPLDGTLVRAL